MNTTKALRLIYAGLDQAALAAEQVRMQDLIDHPSTRPTTRRMASRNHALISAELDRRWFARSPEERGALIAAAQA